MRVVGRGTTIEPDGFASSTADQRTRPSGEDTEIGRQENSLSLARRLVVTGTANKETDMDEIANGAAEKPSLDTRLAPSALDVTVDYIAPFYGKLTQVLPFSVPHDGQCGGADGHHPVEYGSARR